MDGKCTVLVSPKKIHEFFSLMMRCDRRNIDCLTAVRRHFRRCLWLDGSWCGVNLNVFLNYAYN
jgi:hypothetical protein